MFCKICCRSAEACCHLVCRAWYACLASPSQVSTSGLLSCSSRSSEDVSLLSALEMSALAVCRAPKLTSSMPSPAMVFPFPVQASERQAEAAAAVGHLAGSGRVARVVADAGSLDRLSRLGKCLVERLQILRILQLDLLERHRAAAFPVAAELLQLAHELAQRGL